MINWELFDWETFEAYIAHFQEQTCSTNFSDVGTSLEIALELASNGQLKRVSEETYYDLITTDIPLVNYQAKKSKENTVVLKNGRGENKTKINYADYYLICDYDGRKLFQISGKEVERDVIETGNYKNNNVTFNITRCKKKVIWSGNIWKTLNDSADSWFKTKHNAFYNLWYNCKNNVKQKSPIGTFIE